MVVAALVGLALVALRRQPRPLILAVTLVAFFVGTCASPLHWDRWTIQGLPLVCLLAAFTVDTLARRLAATWRVAGVGALAFGLLAVALVYRPAYVLAIHDLQQQNPTRLQARAWLLDNLPAGTMVGVEMSAGEVGVPLTDTPLTSERIRTLYGASLDDYWALGIRHVAISSSVDGPGSDDDGSSNRRRQAVPARLAEMATFRPLTAQLGDLPLLGRAECACSPSAFRGEPTFTIYQLNPP
jgi:hypothetical protein